MQAKFSNHLLHIANKNCVLKNERIDRSMAIVNGACLCAAVLMWGISLSAYPNLVAPTDGLQTLFFLVIVSLMAPLPILKSRGLPLLEATRPLSQSSNGCQELLTLKKNGTRVARYIDGVVLHRQLYHFDLVLARYIELLDKDEEEQNQRLQACAALHNTQLT